MKKATRMIEIILLCLWMVIAFYYIWSYSDRSYRSQGSDTSVKYSAVWGTDQGRGNVVAIQPYLMVGDYASEGLFRGKLDSYLSKARSKGWFGEKTVVVFPEYLGTWLAVAGEKSGVYTLPTMDGAMKLMAASNLYPLLKAYVSSPAQDKLTDAIFRMKAGAMAKTYNRIMPDLARRYHVTIVAGSILLPSPSIKNGKLVPGSGPLENVSPVYLPDGSLAGISVKAFPTAEEQAFTSRGETAALPVFATPAGQMGVLICADSWFPQAYQAIAAKGATLAVIPSYVMGDHAWQGKWQGYSGYANPADVDRGDLGRISEYQAWLKYAIAGRLPKSGIANGVTVCLRGKFWDLGTDGATVAVSRGKVFAAPDSGGASIINLWLQ